MAVVFGNLVGNAALGTVGTAYATAAATATINAAYTTLYANYIDALGAQQMQQAAQMNTLAGQMQQQQIAQEYLAYNQQASAAYVAREEALQRSKELFEHHLTEDQIKEWRRDGRITVRGGYSGAEYQVEVAAKSYNIFGRVVLVPRNGRWSVDKCSIFSSRSGVRICCAPYQYDRSGNYHIMPMYDTILGQKLALELDELAFIERANVSRTA